MDTCSVDGCGAQILCRAMCSRHYQRWKRYGDPQHQARLGRPRQALEKRYVVDPSTGCWIFQGGLNPEGYGNVRYGGRNTKAHRLAAHLWLGFDLDDPAYILHSCDNPSCINPAHLRPGSAADNACDMVERGRQYVPGIRGLEHWNGRLSAADVQEIRRRVACGERQNAIAREFGVHPTHVNKIVNRKART